MQHIMTHTTNKLITLQSAEIFANAIVIIKSQEGKVLYKRELLQTNYLAIESDLPKGEYTLLVIENGKQWKRNILV